MISGIEQHLWFFLVYPNIQITVHVGILVSCKMIWVTRYLCHLTAVKSVDRHLNFDPDTGKCRFNKGFYNTEMAVFDLVKSESSYTFEAGAKDKRLHSSRKEFWIGLAKDTLSCQQISTEQFPFKRKKKSKSCPKLQEPKIKRNIVCLHVSNCILQLQPQTSHLDVPVRSKRCRQGKRRTT